MHFWAWRAWGVHARYVKLQRFGNNVWDIFIPDFEVQLEISESFAGHRIFNNSESQEQGYAGGWGHSYTVHNQSPQDLDCNCYTDKRAQKVRIFIVVMSPTWKLTENIAVLNLIKRGRLSVNHLFPENTGDKMPCLLLPRRKIRFSRIMKRRGTHPPELLR